jgi:hypothetical protein
MTSFWRRIVALDPARASALVLGVTFAICLSSYVYFDFTSRVTPGALVAALAALAVAGSGLLYAWRLGPGGLGD